MSRRKGEMTSAMIDREWPHQVALRADITQREFHVIEAFCRDLSRCPRGHSVVDDETEWWNVYCFAVPEHAAKFMARFGGETFPPDRGKGRLWREARRKQDETLAALSRRQVGPAGQPS